METIQQQMQKGRSTVPYNTGTMTPQQMQASKQNDKFNNFSMYRKPVHQSQQDSTSSGAQSVDIADNNINSSKEEALWKKKVEEVSKNAINQLQSKHELELTKQYDELRQAKDVSKDLSWRLIESHEFYYQLYIQKCELSLQLLEKQNEIKQEKEKSKEIAKRYYAKIDEADDLTRQIKELTESYHSRFLTIQQKGDSRSGSIASASNNNNKTKKTSIRKWR